MARRIVLVAIAGMVLFSGFSPNSVSGETQSNDLSVVSLMGAEMCTGFFVAPNVLMTAAHCVYGVTPSAVVFGPRQAINIYIPACYLPTVNDNKRISCDWAVVYFVGPQATVIKDLSTKPEWGTVHLKGYPWNGGVTQKDIEGQIYLMNNSRYAGIIFYSNKGIPGFSGGPVTDTQGRVIAIHNHLILEWGYYPGAQSGAGAAITQEMLTVVANAPKVKPFAYHVKIPAISR